MDAEQRDQAIAEWYHGLHAPSHWENISAQYRYLMRLADRLMSLGQIDPMERFEMMELLTGAYCHYTEETPTSWCHPASDYDVYNAAGVQTGSIRGNRYFLHGPGVTLDPMGFFAQIHKIEGETEHKIITKTYQHYGVLQDRFIFTNTGDTLTLVETSRMMDGAAITRLDDPDIYRSITDAALLALEAGDMPRYIKLWERESFSIFTQCSSCCDRFELREDCQACDGLGFVVDPQCPSRLPPGCVNQS